VQAAWQRSSVSRLTAVHGLRFRAGDYGGFPSSRKALSPVSSATPTCFSSRREAQATGSGEFGIANPRHSMVFPPSQYGL